VTDHDSARWAAWQRRMLEQSDARARRLLAELPAGPAQAAWFFGARWGASTTAQVIREWWLPDAEGWLVVPGDAWAVASVPSGVLIRYPEPWADDPVALARVPYLAYRAGVLPAARLIEGLGLALILVASADDPALSPGLQRFRAWFQAAGAPDWARTWDDRWAAAGIGPGTYDRDPAGPGQARALLEAGLPPHAPPGAKPPDPDAILVAAASLGGPAGLARDLSQLVTHALEGVILTARWKEALAARGDQ
jgi:hypothetical protein